jgi:hypothetical protein
MRLRKKCWGILVAVLLLPACGGKHGTVTTVGNVQLKGQPVRGAVVEFHPAKGEGRYARGVSETDGNFRLQTDGADGAAPGTYKVTVVKFRPPSKTDAQLKQSLLPGTYASKQTTPLQFTVPHDGPILLDLRSQEDVQGEKE